MPYFLFERLMTSSVGSWSIGGPLVICFIGIEEEGATPSSSSFITSAARGWEEKRGKSQRLVIIDTRSFRYLHVSTSDRVRSTLHGQVGKRRKMRKKNGRGPI